MSYETYALKLSVHVSDGAQWTAWEKTLQVPFAPTKKVGITVGGGGSLKRGKTDGHLFGASSASVLSWDDDAHWFVLEENIATGNAANPRWLVANGFEKVSL